MNCKKCGLKIHINDNYCKRCGKKLNKFSKLKTTSLMLGLSGLLISPYLAPLSFIFGIIGLIFSVISTKRLRNTKGIILNFILILVSFFMSYLQIYLIFSIDFRNINNLKRIGNEYVGYINVPKDMNNISDYNNNKIVYRNDNGEFITLYTIEIPSISAKDYSENIKYEYSTSKLDNIKFESFFEGDYYINEISCYDSDSKLWKYNWVFKEKDGDLHHIEIHVYDGNSRLFDLINTYNLKG